MEYIEREEAKNALYANFAFHAYAGGSAAKTIDAIPAADVREVVLCRDCKHSKVDSMGERYCDIPKQYNGSNDTVTLNILTDDWFCADGERKGGDGE